MEHCRSCDSTIRKSETACVVCGTPVAVEEGPTGLQRRFQAVVTVFLIFTLALMVLSVFTDVGLSFGAMAAVSLVLILVRNSAVEMTVERQSQAQRTKNPT